MRYNYVYIIEGAFGTAGKFCANIMKTLRKYTQFYSIYNIFNDGWVRFRVQYT